MKVIESQKPFGKFTVTYSEGNYLFVLEKEWENWTGRGYYVHPFPMASNNWETHEKIFSGMTFPNRKAFAKFIQRHMDEFPVYPHAD